MSEVNESRAYQIQIYLCIIYVRMSHVVLCMNVMF